MPTLFDLHFCWDATTFLQNPIAGHGQGTDWKNRQTSSDGLVLGPPETHPVTSWIGRNCGACPNVPRIGFLFSSGIFLGHKTIDIYRLTCEIHVWCIVVRPRTHHDMFAWLFLCPAPASPWGGARTILQHTSTLPVGPGHRTSTEWPESVMLRDWCVNCSLQLPAKFVCLKMRHPIIK